MAFFTAAAVTTTTAVYLRPKNRFPIAPQREGASTRYKYRAKHSTNGVGIKTPLQEVYIIPSVLIPSVL